MSLRGFYLAAFLPFLIVILLMLLHFKHAFVYSLGLYCIYRGFLDYYKLKKAGVVGKKDIWKFIALISTFLYFEELYFKK